MPKSSPHQSVLPGRLATGRLGAALLLIILCGVLFFAGLGRLPLKDFDEAYYAGGAQEMLARHELLTPYLNGRPLLVKPILVFWLEAISFRAFGIGEFAARFWSALAASALVLLVYLFGGCALSPRAGLLAGLMLATCYQWTDLGRDGSIDMVLTLLTTLFLMLFFLSLPSSPRPVGRLVLVGYVLLGLAVLAKGPVPVGVVVVSLLAYLLATGQTRVAIKRCYLLPGVILFLATALPWYIAEARQQPRFLATFLLSEHLGHWHGQLARTSPPWGHLLNVLWFFFPWSLFLPAALASLRGRWRRPGPVSFAAWWAVAIIVLFSLPRVRLAHYIAPAFPALALLTGAWFDGWLRRREGASLWGRVTFAALIVGGATLAAALLPPRGPLHIMAQRETAQWGFGIWPWLAAGVIAASCMASGVLSLVGRRWAAWSCLLAMAVFAEGVILAVLLPRVALAQDQPRKELALLASRQLGSRGRLGVYDTKVRATIFYARRGVTQLSRRPPEAVLAFLHAGDKAAVITDADHVSLLVRQGKNVVWARRGRFVLIGNQPPGTPEQRPVGAQFPHAPARVRQAAAPTPRIVLEYTPR